MRRALAATWTESAANSWPFKLEGSEAIATGNQHVINSRFKPESCSVRRLHGCLGDDFSATHDVSIELTGLFVSSNPDAKPDLPGSHLAEHLMVTTELTWPAMGSGRWARVLICPTAKSVGTIELTISCDLVASWQHTHQTARQMPASAGRMCTAGSEGIVADDLQGIRPRFHP